MPRPSARDSAVYDRLLVPDTQVMAPAHRVLSAYPLANLLRVADGREVEWEATGTGEPLMWIEGGPGFAAHLARPDVALVSHRFTCHLVNPPGSGRTTPPSTADGYGLDAHVAFFEEVRLALGLGPLTVMGHSWGGLVAVAWAIAHPAAVRRLIVIDGYLGDASVDPDAAAAERDTALDRLRDRPWFDEAVACFDLTSDDEAEQIDLFSPAWPVYFAEPERPVSRRHVARIRREMRWNVEASNAWSPEPPIDLRPRLSDVRCPTLVIVGEHDFICGPVWNRPTAAGIAGARLVIVPGAGHLPQYEAPEAVRRAIESWLDDPPTSSP